MATVTAMPAQDRDNAPQSYAPSVRDRIVVARTVPEVEAIREVWKNWDWSPNADIDFYLHILRSRREVLRPDCPRSLPQQVAGSDARGPAGREFRVGSPRLRTVRYTRA